MRRPEEWLLIEWPLGETEPAKYWFSTLPEDIDFTSLVGITKLRWRIEHGKRTFIVSDKRSLTRSQTGNRHGTLRGTRMVRLPPPRHAVHRCLRFSDLRAGHDSPLGTWFRQGRQKSFPPEAYKPRGHAAQAGKAHPKLHRDTLTHDRGGLGQSPATMSMLRPELSKTVVTQ
jgi:hypothetical protein